MDDPDYSDDRGGDRYDDRPPRDPGLARFPGVVTAAGIIWLGAGSLSLLNAMATFALQGQGAGAGTPGGGCCPGIIGIAFLVCGYQTVTGQASDTRGNAIGSLLLGLLQVLAGFAIAFAGVLGGGNGGQGAVPQEVLLIVGGVVGLLGGTLMTAGVLALAGRSQYRRWREENVTSPRRRGRPRREEREEPDDRDDDERDDGDRDKPWKRGR